MKTFIIALKRKIITSFIALSSFLSISTARFERDPQSCGMLMEFSAKRKDVRRSG
ncbi:hypothetical protein [Pedobacter rhizosphaerae]|uniref:Uncharacterized protein n=1 Tax=Pedobacter rhizosphaerae TaxID=390241 RepID=A0A1H9TG82_9SPHI|nr:hypothetical protein [Pedobacter rhizosphaerae]SER95633.1 hypothetical protein SAMN04488023_12230 [Pedobacter rhizosphaerae]